ncbi:MAG: GNAT family N-acetyltransferase, partial [Acidovorax sp.]|nr:GNAT family N-acetyltransferase [Acidovorax sp.]
LISAELVYVFADPATQTSRPVPPALRAIFEGFEAGADMAEVRTGDWNTLGRDAGRVRTEVFVHEQGIPAEIEADVHDISARHAVLYNRLGMPIAAGRLLQQSPGVGRIGRMAVDRSVRGAQWGRQLLDALVAAARARGDTEVQLHAQRSAEGFYRRAGFSVVGEPYEEAGIAHIAMAQRL